MCLQAEPPGRVVQTVAQGQLRVPLKLRAVHRLEEEVTEIQIEVRFGFRAFPSRPIG